MRLKIRGTTLLRAVSSVLLALLVAPFGRVSAAGSPKPPATAPTYHYTVSSDQHCQMTNYNCVLEAMQANSGGQGVFQVAVGDVTDSAGQTPAGLRQLLDSHFGTNAVWFPVVGNHDIKGGRESTSMKWRRDEYETGNGVRTPLKNLISHPGPAGCGETTYSWDSGDAHFVILNEYWNGESTTGSDVATDGDIVPPLRAWLEADLAANKKPFIFVFGHEPAYPKFRHVGDSLDEYPANRDAFWGVLKKYHVQAFICGHIHYYYKELHEGVYQISDGNAGNGSAERHQTYLDIVVAPSQAEIKVWQNDDNGSRRWHLEETIPLKPVPGA